MPQVVLYSDWYSPVVCRACPDLLFVFGDNMLGFGMGGQAIIRSEPNAFGVPTKRKPAMSPGSFFSDANDRDLNWVLKRIGTMWRKLEDGQVFVVPVNDKGDVSLGLERAKLPEKAPIIYAAIKTHVKEMSNAYGSCEIGSKEALITAANGGFFRPAN